MKNRFEIEVGPNLYMALKHMTAAGAEEALKVVAQNFDKLSFCRKCYDEGFTEGGLSLEQFLKELKKLECDAKDEDKSLRDVGKAALKISEE